MYEFPKLKYPSRIKPSKEKKSLRVYLNQKEQEAMPVLWEENLREHEATC